MAVQYMVCNADSAVQLMQCWHVVCSVGSTADGIQRLQYRSRYTVLAIHERSVASTVQYTVCSDGSTVHGKK
jgi:hypothetical protein